MWKRELSKINHQTRIHDAKNLISFMKNGVCECKARNYLFEKVIDLEEKQDMKTMNIKSKPVRH